MTTLITDPTIEKRLVLERRASGADRYDEVWEGICMMTPMANNEHQQMVLGLAAILQEIVGWPELGAVCAGLNLSDRGDDWEHDYRVPDVGVFLFSGSAEDLGTHWRGAADFLVEVTSPDDHTREKLPFYGRLGVRELLVVERQPWRLELYRSQSGTMQLAGQSDLEMATALTSDVVPLTFRLAAGDRRPRIEVKHAESGRCWLV
jgi:Uma2 family endonuclease